MNGRIDILGISAYYHDSAAVLLRNGEIVAAAQEERFTRLKHDASFPANAIRYCLSEGGIGISDLDYIVYYEKPFLKFERIIQTYLDVAPKGLVSFVTAMPVWIKEKLFLKQVLRKELVRLEGKKKLPRLLFTEHHHSHAASAFYPSPYQRAAILCMDGVGEWATTSVWIGEDNRLIPQWQIDFPHSLGLLYSAFTCFCGFEVNSGEYKLMGLAPYGEPRYVKTIMENLIDLKDDGTFRLNMEYFGYLTGLRMTNERFERLFGGPPRRPEGPITEREMDIARSIQEVTEEVVLRIARTVHRETGLGTLCMAGGVALNCVANGRLLREGPFKDIWVQPAAGDAGGALGAALAVWYEYLGNNRTAGKDMMKGSYLGPVYSNDEIKKYLDKIGAKYEEMEDEELIEKVAGLISQQKVIGWFRGRMEFGPRALGSRSIIGDPRDPEMQSIMNLKIKFRESFRPFAPAVLEEDVGELFEWDRTSPYMLFVAKVKQRHRIPLSEDEKALRGVERLKTRRSTIPSVTHLDYTARIQTVNEKQNPALYSLLKGFKEKTGYGVLINTSFNVKDEPIVCGPDDAYRCFMKTGMDYLVMGNYFLAKSSQPTIADCNKGGDDSGPHTRPIFLKRLYRAWMRFSMLLGKINSYLILGLVFFAIVSPIGLFFRLLGRRASAWDINRYRAESFVRPATDMEKPY